MRQDPYLVIGMQIVLDSVREREEKDSKSGTRSKGT
jgi:hypothetical protein